MTMMMTGRCQLFENVNKQNGVVWACVCPWARSQQLTPNKSTNNCWRAIVFWDKFGISMYFFTILYYAEEKKEIVSSAKYYILKKDKYISDLKCWRCFSSKFISYFYYFNWLAARILGLKNQPSAIIFNIVE